MQGNLFDDLKSLKDKISQDEKNVQEKTYFGTKTGKREKIA